MECNIQTDGCTRSATLQPPECRPPLNLRVLFPFHGSKTDEQFGHAFPFEPLWDSRRSWDYTAHILITLGRTPQGSPRVGSRARKLPDQTKTTAGRNCKGTRGSQSQHQDTPAWQVLHCGEAGRTSVQRAKARARVADGHTQARAGNFYYHTP